MSRSFVKSRKFATLSGANPLRGKVFRMARSLHCQHERFRAPPLTLKIVLIREKGRTRIRLSGELHGSQLEEVRAEIASVAPPVVLDLEEVRLVDIEAVHWLNGCQAEGLQLDNCAPYIREWMFQERLRT
jgi:hypothetical protein